MTTFCFTDAKHIATERTNQCVRVSLNVWGGCVWQASAGYMKTTSYL